MNTETVRFDSLPSFLPAYGKALLTFKDFRKNQSTKFEPIRVQAKGIRIEPDHVSRYSQVCGLDANAYIPPLYLQVLAARLHASMLTSSRFPLRALGLIHQKSRVLQKRPILKTEVVDIFCSIDNYRYSEKGVTFDLVTYVHNHSELLWMSTTTLLSRSAPATAATSDLSFILSKDQTVLWDVPEDTGRKYATVSGDYNPIHIHPFSARLFGLKHPIAHGFWTLAKALGEAGISPHEDFPRTIQADFLKPVYLPSQVRFSCRSAHDNLFFWVSSEDGAHLLLNGSVTEGAIP